MIKYKHAIFDTTKRFVDDLGTFNDEGVFNDFYKDICPPELQMKVEHSGTHATFLGFFCINVLFHFITI